MSFILDALKKSESDRQRQSGPALFEVKVAPPRTGLPPWAIAVAALLVVNLAIVMWMLWRHPATRTPDTSAGAAAAGATTRAPAPPSTSLPAPAPPSVSLPAPVAQPPAAASVSLLAPAEDGIRAARATGVQTCARPICGGGVGRRRVVVGIVTGA